MPMPKELKDMNFEQKIAWATEIVVDGILKESFHDGVARVLSDVANEAFHRGVAFGRDQERRQQREKNRRRKRS